MNLAILMLLLTATPDKTTPAPRPLTFAETYDLQVDATNNAVRIYGSTFCTASNFVAVTLRAKQEYANLVDLHHNIPDSEGDEARIKEEEIFIGLRFVTFKIADRQNHCLIDNVAPKAVPQWKGPEGL